MSHEPLHGREIRSLISATGQLTLSLADAVTPEPGPDEVVVRVEAAPLNPSDLGLLFGTADLATLQASGPGDTPQLTAKVPADRLGAVAGRIGQSLPVGGEGAGTVVRAGVNARPLLGKLVGMLGGGTYAQYRVVPARNCIVLPDGATAADGASMFVNPLTALAMVETMHREGHTALIHTAAASNLGQMLVKLCLVDGIDLVNVVRSPAQAELLRALGATHIVDSSADNFRETLINAVAVTGATLCFDAIGGGTIVNTVMHAMEEAAKRSASAGAYSRYGTTTYKQVYIYGGLDTGSTQIDRGYGMSWGIGGFLIINYLAKVGWDATLKLRERVARELTTTFASRYTRTISLDELLQPSIVADYSRKATGEKFLVDPRLGLSA